MCGKKRNSQQARCADLKIDYGGHIPQICFKNRRLLKKEPVFPPKVKAFIIFRFLILSTIT